MEHNKEEQESVNEASSDEYEVGYGKPPKHTRFRPGQSGNARGRPKGTKNLKTDLAEELRERIVVREGDRSQKVSKQRALLKSLVNRAIKGDARATAVSLSTMLRLLDTGADTPDVDGVLSDDDLEILKTHEDRILRSAAKGTHTTVRRDAEEREDI